MGGRTKRTQVALYLDTTKIVALEQLKAKTGLTGQVLLRRAIDRLLVEHGLLTDTEAQQEMTLRRVPAAHRESVLRDSKAAAASQSQSAAASPSLQQKLECAKQWQAEREAKKQAAEPRMERLLSVRGKGIEPAHEFSLAAVRIRPPARRTR